MPSVSYSAVGCDPCLEPDGIDGLEYAAGARWAPPRRRRFRGRSIRERKRSEARPAAQPNHQPEECVQHPLPSAPAPARAPSVCDCGVHDCLLQFNNRDPCGSRYTSAQITIAIGDEVRDQNRSLDLMGGGFGDTDNLINSTLGKMQGMYKSRPAAVEACAVWIARACPGSAQSGSNERQHRLMTPFTLQEAAYKLGFPGFAIQDGGSCHSDATIFQRYDMWGSVPADYLLHQRC